MKRKIIFVVFITIATFIKYSISFAENIPYCVAPPFVQANLPSNVMLVLDYSGSMSFPVYYSPNYGIDESSPNYEEPYYDQSKIYRGYFMPNKNYKKINGVWGITNEANSCDIECEKDYNNEGYYITMCSALGVCSGNELNFAYMTRMDILRWILTGGSTQKVSECVYNENGCSIYDNWWDCNWNDVCVWNWSEEKCQSWWGFSCSNYNNEWACNNNDACTYVSELVVSTLERNALIKIQDASSYNAADNRVEGILQQIGKQTQKPRMGAIIFRTKTDSYNKLYFIKIKLSYDYESLIRKINNTNPNYGTPTKKALDNVEKLFREDAGAIRDYGQDPYKFSGDIVHCAKNFILLMSDGEWRGGDIENQTTDYDPIRPIDDMWKGGKADLVSTLPGNQMVETYTVSMFANPADSGTNALKWMAVYGNYYDKDNNGKPYNLGDNPPIILTEDGYPKTSLTQTEYLENIPNNPEVRPNANNTGPYGYFEGKDPEELKESITEAFREILNKVTSGSATSVLTSAGESGSNIVRAVFYPEKSLDNNTKVDWIGELYSLWFYLGPFAQNIREDTANYACTGEKCLNLKEDHVVDIYFDNSSNSVKVKNCPDLNGDGVIDDYTDASGAVIDESTYCKIESLDDLKPIWEAGKVLWATQPSDRSIFVGLDLDNDSVIDKKDSFTTAYDKELEPYLDTDNLTYTDEVIDYIRGEDFPRLRSRKAVIGSTSGVWKLGDIVYSTPKIVTYSRFTPLNSYHKDYHDSTYKQFIDSLDYDNLSIVFIGANDGMLHAFRLGRLYFPGGNVLVELREPKDGYSSEAWAFIPKNILPYLKYYSDPDYCHLYYVDLTPYVFDASINGTPGETKTASSWRRILIGGLRFGGACGDNVTGAITPPNDTGKVPSGVGMSSYFALDITDPENPKLLWEYTDKDLGFTTTGPAIIHIPYKDANGNDDNTKNGYWYVAFASGPDNYDGTVHRPLYLYVLDLKGNGQHKAKVERKIQLSGTADSLFGNINAFAGRMFNAQVDLGANYSDDAFYFGYTYDDAGSWKGGIIRVATGDDNDVDNWKPSILINNIGPVTASVAHIEDPNNNALWLFFGEGRYFTKNDDPDAIRHIYGIKDPCYGAGKLSPTCTESVTFTDLTDVTNNPSATINNNGWYISLDGAASDFNAERVITDPVVNPINGWVFFTTFKPTGDICGFGGDTYVWTLNYSNGGKAYNLAGSIFLQTSTGTVTKIDLAKEFSASTPATSYGRRIVSPVKGAPPLSVGGTVLVPPAPLENVIHWRQGFVK